MIMSFISCLIGLVYALRAQAFIQRQNEQIQKQRELVALKDEQLGVYESLHSEQARQIALLKEYAATLRQEAGRE